MYKFVRTGLKSNHDDSQWEIGKWRKTECKEICVGFNCSNRVIDALKYVKGEILCEVAAKGKHFTDNDKSTWESMKIVKAWHWKQADSVAMAIFSAELVIDVFEKKYPDDKRPRQAIEAAKEYLKNPSKKTAYAADAARAADADKTLDKIEAWIRERIKTLEEVKG